MEKVEQSKEKRDDVIHKVIYTTIDYHLFCDQCNKEIDDKEDCFFVEGGRNMSETLCKNCLGNTFSGYLKDSYYKTLYIEGRKLDLSKKIGQKTEYTDYSYKDTI